MPVVGRTTIDIRSDCRKHSHPQHARPFVASSDHQATTTCTTIKYLSTQPCRASAPTTEGRLEQHTKSVQISAIVPLPPKESTCEIQSKGCTPRYRTGYNTFSCGHSDLPQGIVNCMYSTKQFWRLQFGAVHTHTHHAHKAPFTYTQRYLHAHTHCTRTKTP